MRIVFHGSANEVGRNCVELDDKFLFDSGIKFTEEGIEYPATTDLARIKAVFLTHAHMDHSGALPMFNHLGLNCPIFCNPMIRDLTKLLLKDSYHIEVTDRKHPAYNKTNITNVMSLMCNAPFGKELEEAGAKLKFMSSGHIPGSASVLVEHMGKTLLYTGDINCQDTRLMNGSSVDAQDVDAMVCESTYGDREHPPRKEVEDAFLSKVTEITERGGSVLIPVFAVGRAQEIMLLLKQRKFNVPVYIDGMSKKVTNLILRRPEFVRDADELSAAYRRIRPVEGHKERREVGRDQAIVLTTSGMLDGGPAIEYLKYYCHNPKNAILLTGYQTDDSNGKLLLDQRRVYIDGVRHKVQAFVEKYDFSAHAGRSELVSLIEKVNPKTLILHHGDPSALQSLKQHFESRMRVFVPNTGDAIDV
jgi:putative mRNA 3-end processing factor